jgi:hypothetical protein
MVVRAADGGLRALQSPCVSAGPSLARRWLPPLCSGRALSRAIARRSGLMWITLAGAGIVRRPTSPQKVYTCAGRAVRYWRHFNMFWLTIIVGVPVGMISVLTNHLIVFLEVSGGIAAFIGFCWGIEKLLNMFGLLYNKDQT